MALEDYKELVGSVAGIATIGQMLSGVFICRDIVRQGSTKNISAVPFIGGLAIGTLMMAFAMMLNDTAMIQVNIAGLVLNVGYTLCYFYFTHEREKFRSQVMKASGFVLLLMAYIRWEDPELVEHRYSIITTVLLMILIAAPLFSLSEIIRTKSSESLPFPMIISGVFVSFLWLLYGIIIQNSFIQFQNIVGLVLLLIQLSLFVIYPSKPSSSTAQKKKAM